MFVIPSVVEAIPKRSFDMVDAAMRHYEDWQGDIDEARSYTHDPPSYVK